MLTDSGFSLLVQKILIEEHRTSHCERHNNKKQMQSKSRRCCRVNVQVYSIVERGVVIKLCYKANGSFTITADLGNNSFGL